MWLQRWLARWDRRNQDVFDGVIPDDVRASSRWVRDTASDGRERLVRTGTLNARVELDDDGVLSVGIRTRRWAWDQIAYLTWEAGNGGSLAVCVYGDPYVHDLAFGARDARVCRALLDDCRAFVEAHGAAVHNTTDTTPSMWWASRPEAQSGYHR
jgi:hypothetical protein